jgi:predicted nucleotidyltransferase
MRLEEVRSTKRELILRLAAEHGASNVRVFGSVARGDSDLHSDVDFLVDLEAGRSLSDLGGLLVELQELLGASVDVVTEKGLRAHARERILAEAVPLWGMIRRGFFSEKQLAGYRPIFGAVIQRRSGRKR